jgi:hypothetical protein
VRRHQQQLAERVKRLERIFRNRSENWDFAGIEAHALKTLSPQDRELLAEAMRLKLSEWTTEHEAVWQRWDDALAKAGVLLGAPCVFSADYLGL